MSNNVTKILFRRGSDSQRQTVIFQTGEPAYTVDTRRLFIGDGVTYGGVPASIVNYGIVSALSGSYVYNTNINTNLAAAAFIRLSGANIGDLVYDNNTTSFYGVSSVTTLLNNTYIVSLSDFGHYNITTGINPNQFYYNRIGQLNIQNNGIGINQLNSNITAGSSTLSGGNGSVLAIQSNSITNNLLKPATLTNSVKITDNTGKVNDVPVNQPNQFLGLTTVGASIGAINLTATGSTALSSNINTINITSPNMSNFVPVSAGISVTGVLSAVRNSGGRFMTNITPVNGADVVNLDYVTQFNTCTRPTFITANFLALSGGQGSSMTGNIYGKAFRADQGIPNNGDSSTNGFAFNVSGQAGDGDTGLFSPIVGGGGVANGIVALYSNSYELLRGYNFNGAPYIGIGTTQPTGELTVVGNGQNTGNLVTTSPLGGSLVLGDVGTAVGNGGAIYLAAGGTAWNFAAIKGYVTNGANNSQGDIAFSTRRNSTDSTLSESMRITSSGNVGIGTNNPSQALEVSGNITATGSLYTGNNGGVFYGDSYNLALRPPTATAPNGATFFQNNAGTITTMYVDSNTNYRVGIGTTSPVYPLDVTGNTRASRVYADNAPINNNELTRKDYVDTQVNSVSTPAGCVAYFASTTAPTGWIKANGAVLPIASYQNLFNNLAKQGNGNTIWWQPGDGPTNFRLPDLRGQFIRGWADNGGVDAGRGIGTTQGDSFASHNHVITDPGHTHTVNDLGHKHGITDLGHTHTVTDPGHAHGGGAYPGQTNAGGRYGLGGGAQIWSGGGTGATGGSGTGITINSNTTGITINSNTTGITNKSSTTGITQTNTTGGTENRPTNIALLACIKY